MDIDFIFHLGLTDFLCMGVRMEPGDKMRCPPSTVMVQTKLGASTSQNSWTLTSRIPQRRLHKTSAKGKLGSPQGLIPCWDLPPPIL